MVQQEDPPDCSLPHRVAGLSAPARRFHRALLRTFLTLGSAPTEADLRVSAETGGGNAATFLGELVAHDVIQRNADGAIRAAYPFSGRPTAHRVHLASGSSFFAMCAIDALGLPFMVGQAARIYTSDPTDGTPITIWIEPATGEQVWTPRETMILADERLVSPTIVADSCCPLINAFASRTHAETWQHRHPRAALRLLTQEEAVAEARTLFEHLLDEPQVLPATQTTYHAC